jgi:ATP-binding cassette subfamily B protein
VTVRHGDRLALDHVTVALPDRGLVALVGASGSGKSTVASLLARFADPDEGRVLIGDTDLATLRESDLYQLVSFAFQDTGMRQTSIRDALTAGRPVAEDQMRLAAEQAAIHDDVSGGQRQRLSLARALLRAPDLLVLDETLSALDPRTRAAVLSSLRAQAQHRTVLLMAHQLHLVQDADRILVLERGRLVGDGSHADLLTRCAAYRHLWAAQTTAGDSKES